MANENIETMTIKFEGSSDIDLETLSDVLKSTVNSLKIVADRTLNENQYCKFKLKDVRKGSIILDIASVVISNYGSILPQVPTIISTFNNILNIKKHLRGNDPKSVEKINAKNISIENIQGNKQTFHIDSVNIYGSTEGLEKELSKIFKAIDKDAERKGISFLSANNEKINEQIDFSNVDLSACSKVVDVSKLTMNSEESINDVVLRVVKADFYGNSKWTFFLNNQRIEADIQDEVFLDKVHHNEILFDGDTKLKVSLKIKYKIDEYGIPIENEKATYSVLLVTEVIQNRIGTETLF
ncbi:hypothetical protein [Thomasclavelia spiroformis]|uniref:Uncharacterized protein n=1 Tax=Thomasclavelia spiroformis TaxID=29348 RepID=A0A1Y4EI40_9FIRM|nr:hypothetical protein [Thomasclavelia spiroformis]OUO69669.1 hypothetical protein B5F64_09025 [Thomasclavelia spiroformis]OUQ04961.1 hypothetical protein B5E91_08100 [Thomasclavelia spiroformis]